MGAAVLFSGSQALALGCVDIPDAKVDLALDSYVVNQNYGRLLPEFKTDNKTNEKLQELPIDRLVGKRLQLDDGDGHVWLSLTKTGETEVTAASDDRVEKFTVPEKLAGLDNKAYSGKLARTFFSLGISWRDFESPLVPAIDLSKVPPEPTISTVAQTTLRLTGEPEVERVDRVEYSCSSRASFVGDPTDLGSMVVLKGAVRARQITTTTTTQKTLILTINDVVEQQTASFDEVATLLEDYPEASNVLKNVLKVDPVATASITPAQDTTTPVDDAAASQATADTSKTAETTGSTDTAETPVIVPAPAVQAAAPSPEPTTPPTTNSPTSSPPTASPPAANPTPGSPKWGPILGTLAAIFSIVLLLLYHPRFTANRARDSVSPAAKAEDSVEESVAVDVVEGERGAAVRKPEPDLTDSDSKVETAASDDPAQVASSVPAAKASQPEADRSSDPKQGMKVAALSLKIAPRVTSRPDVETPNVETPDVETPNVETEAPLNTVIEEASPKSMATRIAVLETISAEAELFQEKLKEAVAIAAADAADSKVIKDNLATAESELKEVTATRDKLLESNQDNRSKLNAVTEESRELKEMVIELRTRLAKAHARIESSQSVIIELEDASKMAIELNADYRAKATDYITENRAMRGRVALLEASLLERDKLLKATNLTNEEISRALLDERVERAAIEDDFNALSRDHETLQQNSDTKLDKASTGTSQAELELKSAQKLITILEDELEKTNEEFKQTQLTHHEKRSENARLRVDHGVRVRLMENNVQELSAHIDALEKSLRENGLDVPALQLTPIDELEVDDELEQREERSAKFKSKAASKNIRAGKRGDVLSFRLKR